MSDKTQPNALLGSRRHLNSRQSIETLIKFARDQDDKILNRHKRMNYAKGLASTAFLMIPFVYLGYLTIGYWRSIYPTSFISTPIEGVNGNVREYFMPEMYLKEREVRKLELGLKEGEEMKRLFKGAEQAEE